MTPIPTERLEELIALGGEWLDIDPRELARELLAAREALALALPILEEDRAILVECHSCLRLDADGEMVPVDGTLEPEVAGTVAEYDRAIEAIRAALQPPRSSPATERKP